MKTTKRVLLLGTKFMMTEKFIKDYLAEDGIEVMDTSDYPDEIDEIDRIIFEELCHNIVTLEAKEFLVNFVWQFPADDQEDRPDAVILGCDELSLILSQDDFDIPVIDSYEAHLDEIYHSGRTTRRRYSRS